MRIDLDILENESCETQDGAVVLAVGVALCERLEALTAAVERVADYVGEIPGEHGNTLRCLADESAWCRANNPPAAGGES